MNLTQAIKAAEKFDQQGKYDKADDLMFKSSGLFDDIGDRISRENNTFWGGAFGDQPHFSNPIVNLLIKGMRENGLTASEIIQNPALGHEVAWSRTSILSVKFSRDGRHFWIHDIDKTHGPFETERCLPKDLLEEKSNSDGRQGLTVLEGGDPMERKVRRADEMPPLEHREFGDDLDF